MHVQEVAVPAALTGLKIYLTFCLSGLDHKVGNRKVGTLFLTGADRFRLYNQTLIPDDPGIACTQ